MGHRDTAPAYQEYASDMLADRQFRLMTFEQRGLLYTMRLEAWVSGPLPTDHEALSKILGIPAVRIKELLPSVLPHFFQVQDSHLVCSDLEKYRTLQEARKQRIVDGGRAGGQKTQQRRRSESPEAPLQTTLQAPLEVGLEAPEWRGEARSGEAKSVYREADISKTAVDEDWTDDYEKAQASEHVIGARPQKVRS